jgi:hypothetical protein
LGRQQKRLFQLRTRRIEKELLSERHITRADCDASENRVRTLSGCVILALQVNSRERCGAPEITHLESGLRHVAC